MPRTLLVLFLGSFRIFNPTKEIVVFKPHEADDAEQEQDRENCQVKFETDINIGFHLFNTCAMQRGLHESG
jgi:hypothetical protein